MKYFGKLVVIVTSILCVTTCVISIYPGWLNDILFVGLLLSFVVVPVALIGSAVFVFIQYRRGTLSVSKLPYRYLAVSFAVLFVTFVSLYFYIPRRLAFALCQGTFQQLVESDDVTNHAFNKIIGPYRIDECMIDDRGGTYFRVYSGADGISPDVMSYGFCYAPNRLGSPFGASHYRTFRLGEEWYWFRASNDWF